MLSKLQHGFAVAYNFARSLKAVDPRFWLFVIGLVLIGYGAAQISPPFAAILTGLIIIWDCSRPPAMLPGGRP